MGSALSTGMTTFAQRLFGTLTLDASIAEDIESDRESARQALAVILVVACAGGIAANGLAAITLPVFFAGATAAIGGWLVWVLAITVIGTVAVPEPQTHSSVPELFRTLGFAAAPGVFVAFAAMREVAPFVLKLVAAWMVAAAVMAIRQALDYRSTGRAIVVCVLAWLLTFGTLAAALNMRLVSVS